MANAKRTKIGLLAVAGLSALILLGCVSDPVAYNSVPTSQAPAAPAKTPYVIQPGDELEIKFFYNPELNETVSVRPDGKIALQLIDSVRAAGKTPKELDKELTDMYGRELRKPVITVIVRSFASQRIYVGGEVLTQGLVDLSAGMTAIQAIFKAGGFLETAQPGETIVIRKAPDRQPIPIRVDLLASMQGNGNDAAFRLQPCDIVYVPKSSIAKANKWVKQYIQDLFLFNGISFGFTFKTGENKTVNF